MRLGYEVTSITSLVYELSVYLNGRVLKRGEGTPIVSFLTNCFSYLQSVALDKERLEQSTEFALDLLSLLLDHPGSITKPADLSMAHNLIVEYAVLRASARPATYVQIARPNFWAEVVQIEPEDELVQLPLSRSSAKVKNRKSSQLTATLDMINNNVPRWLTDTVELNLTRWRRSGAARQEDLMLAIFYRNLASFLPKHFLLRRQ